MIARNDGSVYFVDGYVTSKNNVLIAAKLNSLSESNFSRVLYYADGSWKHTDIFDSVCSVAYCEADGAVFWLGADGLVTVLKNNAISTERIQGPLIHGPLFIHGPLSKIKLIGKELFVCGYGGQIYVRTGLGSWSLAVTPALSKKYPQDSVNLEDIDGAAEDDIYCVGWDGLLMHFDGKCWTNVYLPTNKNISSIRCVAHDKAFLCGDNGIFMSGYRDQWADHTSSDYGYNFWDVECFKGKVYLTNPQQLLCWDGRTFEEVHIPTSNEICFHRLHSNDDVLWAFCVDDLFYFDGDIWSEVVCPENRSIGK